MIREESSGSRSGSDSQPREASDVPDARRRRREERLKVLKDSIEELKREPESGVQFIKPPDDPARSD